MNLSEFTWKVSRQPGNFIDDLKLSRQSGKFTDNHETFKISGKFPVNLENFPDNLDIFQTIWKV